MLTDFGLLNKYVEIFLIFLFVIITELLVRYFAEREFAKKRTLKKKLSPYREQDLIRLVGNLEAENVLEAQEVRLLRAAFNFDEETVEKHFKLRKKVILLSTDMTFKEILQIYYKYHYTRYPVLSEERKLVDLNTKLNTAFETCQKSCQHLAIVVDKQKKFIGIITLEDILESLVGKIEDENEVSAKH
ncbi:13046_t:CDS:2 [Entrophospora sp. SA101]|nr:13046_t:CDS:2 [Entrophospora sp. SA101]CAJ0846736.1 12376_t:CDS:2 [Entrophospora sp. SA101]CAJ0894838.1 7988_t:CDS:2 [Entrophospora sp. SA101]